MANKERFTKAKIYAEAMDKIKKYAPPNLMSLIDLLSCSHDTFYKKIKVDSKEYNEISEAIKKRKEGIANYLRKKLADSDNPTAIIAALKLYGNEEDRAVLSQQNIDLKASGKIDYQQVTKIEGNLSKLNDEEIKQLNALLEKIKE